MVSVNAMSILTDTFAASEIIAGWTVALVRAGRVMARARFTRAHNALVDVDAAAVRNRVKAGRTDAFKRSDCIEARRLRHRPATSRNRLNALVDVSAPTAVVLVAARTTTLVRAFAIETLSRLARVAVKFDALVNVLTLAVNKSETVRAHASVAAADQLEAGADQTRIDRSAVNHLPAPTVDQLKVVRTLRGVNFSRCSKRYTFQQRPGKHLPDTYSHLRDRRIHQVRTDRDHDHGQTLRTRPH